MAHSSGHKRPNILLIETDQWNGRCLSALGRPEVATPVLDGMAVAGAIFPEARTNSPICMPSRASMLTGRYPSGTGVFGFSGETPREATPIQHLFREDGYHTGAMGKFHARCFGARDFGFDFASPSLPEERDLAAGGGRAYGAWCRERGFPWPNDQIHGHVPEPDSPSPRSSHARAGAKKAEAWTARSDVPVEGSLETWTTDECLRYLEGRASAEDGKPFFCWLTYDRPHPPTTLPEPWYSRAMEKTGAPLTEFDVAAAEQPGWFRERIAPHLREAEITPEVVRRFRATYLALCEWIDSEIGRVLRKLEALGLDGDTHIVFTADHGDEAGVRCLINKFTMNYSDEVVRVPLVVRPAAASQGFTRGARPEAPVTLVDVLPTLRELAGLPVPAAAEGVSFVPALRGEPHDPGPQICDDLATRTVVEDGWALAYSPLETGRALYHVAEDPYWVESRYGSTREDAVARRYALKRRLLDFLHQRIQGGFGEADRRALEDGLEGGGDAPPLVATHTYDQVVFFRAGLVVHWGDHSAFFPRYDAADLLFARSSDLRRARALEAAQGALEAGLDAALDECFSRICPRSVLRTWQWPARGANFVNEERHT